MVDCPVKVPSCPAVEQVSVSLVGIFETLLCSRKFEHIKDLDYSALARYIGKDRKIQQKTVAGKIFQQHVGAIYQEDYGQIGYASGYASA